MDSLGESGLDRVIETRMVIICQLPRVGTFVDAKVMLNLEGTIGMLLARCPVGVVERGMTSLVKLQMVSLVVQPSLTIMTHQRQILGSRHPCKMVSPSRLTLQPVLWKNTLQPASHRTAMERG